jgi:hypothetical protein
MADDLGSYHVPDPDDRPKRVTPVNFLNRLKETEARRAAAAAKAKEEAAAQREHDQQAEAVAAQQAKQEAEAAAEADRHAAATKPPPSADRADASNSPAKRILLVVLGGLLLGVALIVTYERFFRDTPIAAPVSEPTPSAPLDSIQVAPQTTPDSAGTEVPSRGIPPAQE